MGRAIGERAGELVDGDEMPPVQYRPAHSAARLRAAEKQQLIAGLRRTFAQ